LLRVVHIEIRLVQTKSVVHRSLVLLHFGQPERRGILVLF
jgi:hypothetical protein